MIFNDSTDHVLKQFIHELKMICQDNLYSIMIYGSLVLNDFIEGKGDIDFLVVLKANLTNSEINQIITLHEQLRGGKYGLLGNQLEGAYYTLDMFHETKNENKGFYVGTTRKGWKVISKLNINCFDRRNIIDHGQVIYGVDIRHLLKKPSLVELKKAFINELKNRIDLLEKYKDVHLIIDTFYFTLRGISLFEFNELVSKSKGVKNYISICEDDSEKEFVKYLSNYRYPLSKHEMNYFKYDHIYPYLVSWLDKIYMNYYKFI